MQDKASFAKRLMSSPEPAADTEDNEEGQDETALARRAVGQVPMLELRLKNGECVSFAYSYLWSTHYDPSNGITLDFPAFCQVEIKGHALRQLYAEISEHKRRIVEELSSPAIALSGKERPHVSQISIVKKEKDQ